MKDCCKKEKHPDHSTEISRLNRVSGQLEGIKKMIEERRYCPDIITQLRAASSAIKSLEANILDRHLKACVTSAFKADDKDDQMQKIDELIKLFSRFD